MHKIDPCHFRGHALCWKLQGTPFPLANRPCFMWVKDTGRAAQQGGSFLILILYAVKFGAALSEISSYAHFAQLYKVKFSSKDVNLGTKKRKPLVKAGEMWYNEIGRSQVQFHQRQGGVLYA